MKLTYLNPNTVTTCLVFFFFFSFLGWGETVSTWYVGHKLAYCTNPG
jgi:hypothetical protein